MTEPMTPDDRLSPDLLAIAFAQVAERGWHRFSVADVARRAGITFAEAQKELPTRWHVLRRLSRRLDRATFDVTPASMAELSPRDRLFELIMRRLDAAAPYKEGLRRLRREARADPALVAMTGTGLQRSARLMLDIADGSLGPVADRLGSHVLTALYLRVFAVWLDDETEDQARTLAELDRRLQQAERAALFVTRCRPSRRSAGRDEPMPDEGAERPA